MNAFFQGIVIGLTFAALLGPGFFAQVQTSIQSGFKAGASLSVGIFLSDIAILLFCFFGITQLLGINPQNNPWFRIIAGSILITLGGFAVIKNPEPNYRYPRHEFMRYLNIYGMNIIKGFFLNAFNPGIWIMWITVIVAVGVRFNDDKHALEIFFPSILLTTLSSDLLKCYISHHIRRYFKMRTIKRINQSIGFILIFIGVFLMLFSEGSPMMESRLNGIAPVSRALR
jgi:threonine/homoserine/homoserine lactone efflux protein